MYLISALLSATTSVSPLTMPPLLIKLKSEWRFFAPSFQIRCLRIILNWPRQIPNDLIELVVPITSITDMIARIALRYQRELIGNHPALNFF